MSNALKYLFYFLGIQIAAFVPALLISILLGKEYSQMLIPAVGVADILTIVYVFRNTDAKVKLGFLKESPWRIILLAVLADFLFIIPGYSIVSGFGCPDYVDLDTGSLLGIIVVGIIVPIAEEVFFRGAIQNALIQWDRIKSRPYMAILVSALLFSLGHLNPAQIPSTLVFGLIMGWLAYRTGSLVPGIAVHIFHNSLASILDMVDSNTPDAFDEIVDSPIFWSVDVAVFTILWAICLLVLIRVVNSQYPSTALAGAQDRRAGKWLIFVTGIIVGCSVIAGFVSSDRITYYDFQEGRAKIEKNGKIGYINAKGKSEMMSACDTVPEISNIKAGLVAQHGYDRILAFEGGLWGASKDKKFGYINSDGEEVIPFEYDSVYGFHDGLAEVEIFGKYGYIDTTGRVVIPVEYESLGLFSEGLAAARSNGKYGFIDKSGNELIPFKYDSCGKFSGGLAPVGLGENMGFINTSGIVTIPLTYDEAGAFNDGLALVAKDGKYGFVRSDGTVAVPLIYDHAWDFHEGIARVRRHRKGFYIDKEGSVILKMKRPEWSDD